MLTGMPFCRLAIKIMTRTIYTGISGFVRDMTIREYLKDGGIRIRKVLTERYINIKRHSIKRPHARGHAPSKVSIDEWYEIIRPFVKKIKINRSCMK